MCNFMTLSAAISLYLLCLSSLFQHFIFTFLYLLPPTLLSAFTKAFQPSSLYLLPACMPTLLLSFTCFPRTSLILSLPLSLLLSRSHLDG